MGQDNVVPRRINKVEGAAGQVIVSGGAGVVETWEQKKQSYVLSTTRDMTAASADVGYTGVGFQPTCIIIIACIDGSYQFTVGLVNRGGNDKSVSTTSATNWFKQEEFIKIATGGGKNQLGNHLSFDSDGFTLRWVKQLLPVGIAQLKFLCLR